MSLVDLPQEIMDMILDNIIPEDLVNFLRVCKKLNRLAALHQAAHQSFIARYSAPYLALNTTSGHDRWSPPYAMLIDILDDYRIAHYPRFVTLGDCSRMGIEGLGKGHLIKLRERLDFEGALSLLEYLPDPDTVGDGPIDIHYPIIVAILLSLLVNVNKIQFLASFSLLVLGSPFPLFQTALREIIDSHWDSNPNSLSFTPLGKLEHIICSGPSSELFTFFARVPSVKRLHGQLLCGNEMRLAPLTNNGVTDISFLECEGLQQRFIEVAIRICKSLKNFSYKTGLAKIKWPSISPWGFVRCLQLSASNTLETLEIELPGWTSSSFESAARHFYGHGHVNNNLRHLSSLIRQLHRLKKLKVDHRLFLWDHYNASKVLLEEERRNADNALSRQFEQLKVDQEMFPSDYFEPSETLARIEINNVVQMLPASLEQLELCTTIHALVAEGMFAGLQELKARYVPRLEKITVESRTPMPVALRKACETEGISLICKNAEDLQRT